jgi:DNA-binding MarR family transcriptional regulator
VPLTLVLIIDYQRDCQYHLIMAAEPARYETVAFPALLRQARRAYARATMTALAEAGCDDMPRNGSYVLAASARHGAQLSHIIRELGVSKQAAGQLIDTLVSRGYLDRSVDPRDRRRLTISLTERGAAAADVIGAAVSEVDARLLARVSAEQVGHARAVLSALIGLDADLGAGPDRPARA